MLLLHYRLQEPLYDYDNLLLFYLTEYSRPFPEETVLHEQKIFRTFLQADEVLPQSSKHASDYWTYRDNHSVIQIFSFPKEPRRPPPQ